MPGGAFTADLKLPLVLDLDQTLLRVDCMQEGLMLALRRGRGGAVLGAAFGGVSALKAVAGATLTEADVESFPAHAGVVAMAEREHALGREVVLATASDVRAATLVAARFPFIDATMATENGRNLKGATKADALVARYPGGFLYAGDSAADRAVWAKSAGAIVVGDRRVAGGAMLRLPGAPHPLRVARRSMRVHQWAKNALVFVPQLIGGRVGEIDSWALAVLAFVALSLVSSATYILNDLLDLAEDRRHWSKRRRPLASGDIGIVRAVLVMAGCAVFGLTAAAIAGPAAFGVLLLYVAISLAYSLRLKRVALVDRTILAGLFTLRLGLGIAATGVRLSWWLIVFSMFVFLSLSLAKRLTEVQRMAQHGHTRALGRAYVAADAPLLLALGIAAMMSAVLIIVIYLIAEAFLQAFYVHPQLLWGVPVLLFLFLGRIWLLCHRGELDDDPVAFAVRDRASLICGAATLVLVGAAVL